MKRRQPTIVSIFLMTFILFSCGDDTKEPEVETVVIEFKKEGELEILKNGEVTKTIDIEIAETPYERETGLMYRESMEDNQGMLFIFPDAAPRSFYMKNTYIPLDIIYMSNDTTVVSFKENAQPRDESLIPSNAPAKFVLEINGGKMAEWNIEIGDGMRFYRN